MQTHVPRFLKKIGIERKYYSNVLLVKYNVVTVKIQNTSQSLIFWVFMCCTKSLEMTFDLFFQKIPFIL